MGTGAAGPGRGCPGGAQSLSRAVPRLQPSVLLFAKGHEKNSMLIGASVVSVVLLTYLDIISLCLLFYYFYLAHHFLELLLVKKNAVLFDYSSY